METVMAVLAVWMALLIGAFGDEVKILDPVPDFVLKEHNRDGHWNNEENNPFRRHLNENPGQIMASFRDKEDLRHKLKHEDWNQFTPPPIVDVQCHVEIQTTKKIPGRCTKLGGHIPACQTEEYLEIDYNSCS